MIKILMFRCINWMILISHFARFSMPKNRERTDLNHAHNPQFHGDLLNDCTSISINLPPNFLGYISADDRSLCVTGWHPSIPLLTESFFVTSPYTKSIPGRLRPDKFKLDLTRTLADIPCLLISCNNTHSIELVPPVINIFIYRLP